MRCQFNLVECNEKAEFKNANGVCVCPHHKLLLDAFNWETRKSRKWIKIIDNTPDGLDGCSCGHPFEEHDWGAYSKGKASCLVEECACDNFEPLIKKY